MKFSNDTNLIQTSFPFPSNGKPEHKCAEICRNNGATSVSIPFKRETTSQVFTDPVPHVAIIAFPFPLNGNAHRKEHLAGHNPNQFTEKFPFPSNGNAHRKDSKLKSPHRNGLNRFDSLQTGTRITRIVIVKRWKFP